MLSHGVCATRRSLPPILPPLAVAALALLAGCTGPTEAYQASSPYMINAGMQLLQPARAVSPICETIPMAGTLGGYRTNCY